MRFRCERPWRKGGNRSLYRDCLAVVDRISKGMATAADAGLLRKAFQEHGSEPPEYLLAHLESTGGTHDDGEVFRIAIEVMFGTHAAPGHPDDREREDEGFVDCEDPSP